MTMPDDLMHEDEVYQKYGRLLADRELREARKNGLIGWFDLRKGPHYTAEQVMEYLRTREKKPCQQARPLVEPVPNGKRSASSSSTNIGSGERKAPTSSSIIGMTPRLEELAAERLESEI